MSEAADDQDGAQGVEPVAASRVKARAFPLREAVVPVRLTLGERDLLKDTAQDLGMTISTYVRQVVLSRPLPPRRAVRPIPEVNRETYHALGRVGGLLNQIAHRLNERRGEEGVDDLMEVLETVATLLGAVRVELLGARVEGQGGGEG